MLGPDLAVLSDENAGPFDDIAQFPDIARPGVLQQESHGPRAESDVMRAKLAEEALRQQREILHALAERTEFDGKDREPVKQVFSKAMLLHQAAEIGVGSANDANIDAKGVGTAQPLDFSCSRKRSSFDCRPSGRSPISSRNTVLRLKVFLMIAWWQSLYVVRFLSLA